MQTWLNVNISDSIINVIGYNLVRLERQTVTRGGGILTYIKKKLNYEVLPIQNLHVAIEQRWIKLIFKNGSIVIGTIYRRQEYAASEFFENLDNVIVMRRLSLTALLLSVTLILIFKYHLYYPPSCSRYLTQLV